MNPLQAGIRLEADGLVQSLSAMQLEMNVMGIFGENIVGFEKIGYQKKDAVISSFAEYLGSDAVSYSVDDQVGRLALTQKPLDVALSDKGYFQVLNKDGSIELTRDGRFQMDKDGNILTQSGQKVLSAGGSPLVLPYVPEDIYSIKIGLDGKIGIFDNKTRGLVTAGTIGVVSADGSAIGSNCVRQGYLESSNVQLEREYLEMANNKRSFEANAKMFRLQNSKLSNAIQKLGSI